MKTKELKFLENKLSELVDNKIITKDQFDEAHNFFNVKKEKKSVSIIFSSIGLLLIGLSIITLFAVNWDNISREFKCIVAFIPMIITSIMLYYSMKNENKNMKISTSIVAPISIFATNSLIGQIFHLQFNVYNLIFFSLLMFMPIAFIIRNYISVVVYGVLTIIYSFYSGVSFNMFILTLPLAIYSLYNYVMHKEDKKNLLLWIFNVIMISLLLVECGILREKIFIIYIYILSLITKLLFKNNNKLSKVFSFIFMLQLFLFCAFENIFYLIADIEFGLDIVICLILSIVLFILTKEYKNVNECFILVFVILANFPIIDEFINFIFINLIALVYGIYEIIYGYKMNLYRNVKKGIATILFLIFVRFFNAKISFMTKSILFLVLGIIFIVESRIFKHKIEEGNKDE